MAPPLVFIAFMLPIIAGAVKWPWYLVSISGVTATVGFCLANAQTVERSRERGSVVAASGGLIAANTTGCAVLFGLGQLLSLL